MFKIYDGREKFYQWDIDRQLIVEDPSITEVHFTNRATNDAYVCETYVEDGITLVNVPNILLQANWRIQAYAYDGKHTKHDVCYEVISRSKPDDYMYTETEIKTWNGLEQKVEDGLQLNTELVERAEVAADNAEASEEFAAQAVQDLLAMINSGDIVLATNGVLPLSAIPATATQEIYVVESEDELTGLVAQFGDLAELVEEIDGEMTITKTWQCLGNAANREDWIVWGTSYAVQSGNATSATNATNANMINNHRLVEMTEEDFKTAVKDANTYYLVY